MSTYPCASRPLCCLRRGLTALLFFGLLHNSYRVLDVDVAKYDTDSNATAAAAAPTERPDDGCYIHGLFLEGARWDARARILEESKPKQLYTSLPPMHFLPVPHRASPTGGVYRCPVYKILNRQGTLSTTGHSTNFIMYVSM